MLVLGALVLVNLYVFVWDKKTGVGAIKQQAEKRTPAMPAPTAAVAVGCRSPAAAPQRRRGSPRPSRPPGSIEGKVGKSDTLGRLLKKSGLSAAEADEVIRALSGVLDFRTIRAGQTFRIERGADGRVKLFELDLSKVQTVRAERQPSGELVGIADDVADPIEIKAIGGTDRLVAVRGDQGSRRERRAGRLLRRRVRVRPRLLQRHPRRRHVPRRRREGVRRRQPASEFLRYGRILAAEYRGKAGTFQTFYFWNGQALLRRAASPPRSRC